MTARANWGNCQPCHHFRQDGPPTLPLWCALQRLPDPSGKATVHHRPNTGRAFNFTANGPAHTSARTVSPGPAFGFSVDFRTGEKRPHRWNRCPEFIAATPEGPAA